MVVRIVHGGLRVMPRRRRQCALGAACAAGAVACAIVAQRAGTAPLFGAWAFACALAVAWVWGQL